LTLYLHHDDAFLPPNMFCHTCAASSSKCMDFTWHMCGQQSAQAGKKDRIPCRLGRQSRTATRNAFPRSRIRILHIACTMHAQIEAVTSCNGKLRRSFQTIDWLDSEGHNRGATSDEESVGSEIFGRCTQEIDWRLQRAQ